MPFVSTSRDVLYTQGYVIGALRLRLRLREAGWFLRANLSGLLETPLRSLDALAVSSTLQVLHPKNHDVHPDIFGCRISKQGRKPKSFAMKAELLFPFTKRN